MAESMDLWRLIAVLLALGGFGTCYNHWVAGLERNGHDRGYMAFIVAIGCVVVIGGWLLITGDLEGGVYLLAAFAAAGIPMIVGSVQRYVRARSEQARALREENERFLDG